MYMDFSEEPIYDIHSHILPGVDDGAKNLEESLAILEEEIRQGVGTIVLTPHFRKRMFETPESVLYSHYKMLVLEASERFPELELKLGCEFHAHMDMEEELRTRRYATMADTNFLLLEFSGRHTKSMIRERTNAVLREGFMPIIAHAERYPAMHETPELIGELRDIGVKIQVNADSILGYDGVKLKAFCKKLIKNDWIDLIGSDVHNLKDRKTHIGECAEMIAKKYGESYAGRIFRENPGELFD